jgi:hypothetical protein
VGKSHTHRRQGFGSRHQKGGTEKRGRAIGEELAL